jgi:PAS domain S-box-containing protein
MGAGLELFGVRKGGGEFPIEVSLSPVETREGILVTSTIRDVTERKLVEESRFRLAAIVESSDDAIVSKNLDAVIVSWNAAAEHIFGYTEQEAVGRPITILIPSELREEENKIFEKLRAGARINHYETVRVTKAGKKVNVSLSISPVKDSTGRIVGFSKIARDITPRKQAEEALRASEERLRLAQQAARIGTFERDVRTGIVTCSAELDLIYGLSPGTFDGTTTAFFVNLVHPDDRARVIELFEGALKTGQSTWGEWRVVWPDGSIRWIAGHWQVFMNESGEPSRMIGVNGDITERKLAEEALRESEQRLRLATQVGRMYAYDWDVKSDLVVRSSEHVEILGLTDPLRRSQNQFVDKIHPDDRPRFLAAIAGLTPQNPTAEVTYRALASDGTLVWLKSNGRGFFDAEGKMLRVIGMVADVTDIKQAEEALSEMTRKLIEAQERERARIGRELHDDINQRLAMLGIELERLQHDPSEIQKRLKELREQTNEISNDVQALSHELHASKLEYLGFVAGMRSWCREFGERQGMEINFKTDVGSRIPAEIGLTLFRISQEALHNAVKHSGVKGIKVQLLEHSNEIHLTISDAGKGFDTEAVKQGRGLGLTSMQERVRLVNGAITIESKLGEGTTIHVHVPFDSEEASRQAAS